MNWDFIVIGAGSAGCAVAHELAKSGRTVLVLEAGGSDWSPFIKIPAGLRRAAETHDWGYRSRPDPSRNGAADHWKRGRVLGGSSSINGTVYVRGAAADFDRWAEQCGAAAREWSAQEVMPIFRALEASDQPGPARGHHGPHHVRTVRRPHAMTQAFVQSARAAGYPFNADYNGDDQEGVSYIQLAQHRGLRWSAADAFLKPLLGRTNVQLVLHANVRKIEMARGRAVGVAFLRGREMRKETARDVILCAGAINSPKLLMLSGIGDLPELRRHGIEGAIHLPGVGCNLKDHPLVRLIFRARIPTYNLTEGLLQKLAFAATFLRYREGPIANLWEGVGFLRSSPEEPLPDIQLHFMPAAYLGKIGDVPTWAPYPAVTAYVNKCHPKSSGRVRLASSEPDDAPLIECRLLADESDVDTLVSGIGTVRRIMASEPIAGLLVEEIAPGPTIGGAAVLRSYVRDHTEVAFHPVGTCRMGVDAGAVVGPDLRVCGTDNLWIADASIMPDLVSGNTNAACMMIGMKLGKELAARS